MSCNVYVSIQELNEPNNYSKLWTGGLLESHNGDSLHAMAYPLRIWCR